MRSHVVAHLADDKQRVPAQCSLRLRLSSHKYRLAEARARRAKARSTRRKGVCKGSRVCGSYEDVASKRTLENRIIDKSRVEVEVLNNLELIEGWYPCVNYVMRGQCSVLILANFKAELVLCRFVSHLQC